MVEAIGLAILSAATSSASLAASLTIAGVSLATVVGTATVLGGSLLVASLTTPDNKQKVASQQLSSRQSLPARRRAYGTVMLAGPKVEWKSFGGSFYNAIYHCEGPIGAYQGYWLENTRANLPEGSLGGLAGVAPWQSAVTIEGHLGTADQAASALLQQLGAWTANDRLAGCAYSVTRSAAPPEKIFAKVYPSQTWPEHKVLIRASLVRNVADPAQTGDPATWRWTDLCAPCIRDLITHPLWGMKVPESLIDDASFVAATALHGQPVTNRNGELFPRYYLGGAYDLTEQPADVLQSMLDACDGRLYLTAEGKIGIGGGVYVPPEVTLRDPRILSAGQIEAGTKKRAAFNRLKISFVSPKHDFQVVEGDPWEDLEAQAEAGEILEADFSRAWVQNHNQLRRLAKIHTAKGNPDYRITGLVTDRSGLPAVFEDTIRLVLTRYGIDAVFTVERAVAAGDGSTCVFDLTSLDPAAYSFDAQTEEGIAPALPGVDAAPAAPASPANLTPIVERRVVSGSATAVFLRLVAAPTARADLSLVGRYRRVGDVAWIDMAPEGDNAFSLISSVLADGEQYEAQGAIATYGRAAQSDWTATQPASVTAVADATAPAAPTYTSATLAPATGVVSHAFRQSASANARSLRILRARGFGRTVADATSVFSAFESPNQADTASDAVDLGLFSYWLRAFNGSGVASADAGPLSVVRSMQANNLTTAPYDFTNTAWAKGATTVSAAGTGPDGQNAYSLFETTATSAHYVHQILSITSGSKVRASIGLKNLGRRIVGLFVYDTNAQANFARLQIDFTTGQASAIATGGSTIVAVTGELTKVSADWFILTLTVTANAGSIFMRVQPLTDAGGASYAGDTTKGVGVWAGTLAVVP